MKHVILISGESGTGKSTSLINMPQDETIYLSCEADKMLPFKNNIFRATITDPLDLVAYINEIETKSEYKYIVVDTLTFLMDMYESIYVINSNNTQAAWSQFAQYFKNLMQNTVANSSKTFIFLAHTLKTLDTTGEWIVSVPVKGSLKNQGIEAYFNNIVSTKKMKLTDLKDYQNDLLNITPRDEALGFKYVYQTDITKKTIGERIRSPMGLFSVKQTFIDNDAWKLIQHLDKYYSETN